MTSTIQRPQVGDRLMPKVVVPTTTDLIRFAAASSDYNLIHYDHHYATTRGFSGVIVHGFYKAALLAELALAHAPRGSWYRSLKAIYRGVDNAGAPMVLAGAITAVDEKSKDVTVELTTTNSDGNITTQCTGVLVWSMEEQEQPA